MPDGVGAGAPRFGQKKHKHTSFVGCPEKQKTCPGNQNCRDRKKSCGATLLGASRAHSCVLHTPIFFTEES